MGAANDTWSSGLRARLLTRRDWTGLVNKNVNEHIQLGKSCWLGVRRTGIRRGLARVGDGSRDPMAWRDLDC